MRWFGALLVVSLGCASERRVLGAADLDGWCRATGRHHSTWVQDPGRYEGKKTWGCVARDNGWTPISFGALCSAQYQTTAHGEQERGEDPTSWLCVQGPGPRRPPAHWNRANL